MSFLLTPAAAVAPIAVGAEMCKVIAASSNPAEYRPRDGGRYCDGSFFEPNSGGTELPVIGVSAALITGDPSVKPIALAVSPPPAGVSAKWPLHLQGLAKSPGISYRLDAALASSADPLVIGKESGMMHTPSLQADGVAWSAWSDDSDNGVTYFPVITPGAHAGNVEILVRPTMATAYVTYTLLNDAGIELAPKARASLPKTSDLATPVPITIPAGEPRVIRVKILAMGRSGDTQVAMIRLVRPSKK